VNTVDQLRTHPFLAGLPEPWLAELAPHARRTVYRLGDHLFREGDRADRFWLIREGRISLEFHVDGRGEVVIEQLGPGTVVGWSWMFPPYRWHFTAVAAELAHCIEFDGEGVRRLCERLPALGYELTARFACVLVDRLQAARVRLVDLYGYPTATSRSPTSSQRDTSPAP
jgi:CRP/FNR family cyclic AMP-dependent transcriptional regulator